MFKPQSAIQPNALINRNHMLKRFALIDRDGTINVEKHYLHKPEELELNPGAAEGLRKLTDLGLGIAVITNQSGVGRGYFDISAVEAVHAKLVEILAAKGVNIASFHICPHGPDDNCQCRKPLPGLAEEVAARHGVDLTQCFVIGDKQADIDLGRGVGAISILVRTGYGAEHEAKGLAKPDYVVDDLKAAADLIERLLNALL
jgi:D-glycero-D-manno-heptose 1,7-bisphosphate phosphatase